MKFLSQCLVLALSLTICSQAESLSDADKEKALNWLETYKTNINKDKTNKLLAARSKLMSAAVNESEAFNLYLNCVDQVNFVGKGIPAKEFLAWKNHDSQRNRFSRPGFKRGLRLMCQWLLVGINLAEAEKDEKLLDPTPDVVKILTELSDQVPLYLDSADALDGGAGEIISRALKISDYKPKFWTPSPKNVGAVFEAMIFPILRANPERDIQAYRNVWLKRIAMENAIVIKPRLEKELADKTAGAGKDKDNNNNRDDEPSKKRGGIIGSKGTNLSDQKNDINDRNRQAKSNTADSALSNLYWQMELDCFDFGDERTALKNLMNYLSNTKDLELIEPRTKSLESLLKRDEELAKKNGGVPPVKKKKTKEQEEIDNDPLSAPAPDPADAVEEE